MPRCPTRRTPRAYAGCSVRQGNHTEGQNDVALLLKTRTRVLFAMCKEAKRRGLSVKGYIENAPVDELIALIHEVDPTVNPAEMVPGLPDLPGVDVTRWGMPPKPALSTD